jgi:hypothetical protein
LVGSNYFVALGEVTDSTFGISCMAMVSNE